MNSLIRPVARGVAILALILPAANSASGQSFKNLERNLEWAVSRTPPQLNWSVDHYGTDDRQSLYFIRGKGQQPYTLIIHLSAEDPPIIGNDYSLGWLPSHLFDEGYAQASIVTDEETVSTALADFAEGIAFVAANAKRYRVDLRHVILSGQGTGGAAAALLAMDPERLRAAGLPDGVRAALLFNPVGLDMTREASNGEGLPPDLAKYFGDDPAVWSESSWRTYVQPPNAPAFRVYSLKSGASHLSDVGEFAEALREHGSQVAVVSVSQSRSGLRSSHIGAPGNDENEELSLFLEKWGRRSASD